MRSFEFILLQSAMGDSFIGMLPLFLILLVFYFFMIRPQQKKQKDQDSFLDEVSKGDDVVTASGILGKVNKIEDQIVTLEVGSKTYIQVTKNAISKDMTEAVFSPKSDS